MAFSVTKSSGSFILPSSPTPSGLLPLSSIDRSFQRGIFEKTLHIFKHGINPATVIKQALAKTLVHYHPIAGRFKKPDPDGELQVDCTGEGVWFVEGVADCSLEDVNWLQGHPMLIPEEQLTPSAPEPGLTLMLQVTTFKCGGFVVAILFDHTMTDGIGLAQFTKAIAETARGLETLTVPPVWLRDTAIPTPPESRLGAPFSIPNFHLKPLSVTITTSNIAQLKSRFTSETGKACSTFDVLCAVLWQSRARAIATNPEDYLKIGFPASVRGLVSIPDGYYGNSVRPVSKRARTEALVGESSVKAVELIREAKGKIREEVEKWKKGECVVDGEKVESIYNLVIVSDWTKLGFEEVDYGWGVPEIVMRVTKLNFLPVCFLMKVREGVKLVTRCVKEEHLERFREEMEKVGSICGSQRLSGHLQ